MRIIIPAAITAAAAAIIAVAASGQTTHKAAVVARPSPASSRAQTFRDNCSACHQDNGKGIPGAFPALAGNRFVTGVPGPAISVVLNGRAGMPTFKLELTDEQIAAALSFARSSWGNRAPPVTSGQVAALRTGKAPRPSDRKPIQAN